MAALVKRGLVVAVAGGELRLLREHYLVLVIEICGAISGDVLDGRPAGRNDFLGVSVSVPFGPYLVLSRLQFQTLGLLHVKNRVLLTDGRLALLFFVDRLGFLVLEGLPFLVLRNPAVAIREEQNLRPFLALANLSARFPNLVVGAPTVVASSIADARLIR